jgi:hypothetical protein
MVVGTKLDVTRGGNMKSTVFRSSLLGALIALGLNCTKQQSSPVTPIVAPPVSGGMAGSLAAPATTPTAGRGSAGSGPSTAGTGTLPTGPAAVPATAGTGAGGTGASTAGNGAGGAGGAATASGGAGGAVSSSPFPQLPRVTTTDGPGPFSSVVKVMNTPPGGWMIYPTDIGKGGMKHPLFIFGPGGGTTPQTYEDMGMHWDRYGSYGFVIYVLPQSTGNGADMKAGLDWLIMQNDVMASPLYQHLDTSKVCASGHSEGGITVFDFMPDDRVTTTVIISGGSFDGMGSSHLRNDTMFLCGPDGASDMAQPQCVTDFANSTIPTFYTEVQGSTHITSGRMGWAATIAWMLWHLAGQEDQWKKEFLTPTGQFQTGIYKSQIKNWPP